METPVQPETTEEDVEDFEIAAFVVREKDIPKALVARRDLALAGLESNREATLAVPIRASESCRRDEMFVVDEDNRRHFKINLRTRKITDLHPYD